MKMSDKKCFVVENWTQWNLYQRKFVIFVWISKKLMQCIKNCLAVSKLYCFLSIHGSIQKYLFSLKAVSLGKRNLIMIYFFKIKFQCSKTQKVKEYICKIPCTNIFLHQWFNWHNIFEHPTPKKQKFNWRNKKNDYNKK